MPLTYAQEEKPLVQKLGGNLLALNLNIESIDQNQDGEVVIHVVKPGTAQGDVSFNIVLEKKWRSAQVLGDTIYSGSSRLQNTETGTESFSRLLSRTLKVKMKNPQPKETALNTQFVAGNPNLIFKEPVLIQFKYGSMETNNYVSFRARVNYPERQFTLIEENLGRRQNLVDLFAGKLQEKAK